MTSQEASLSPVGRAAGLSQGRLNPAAGLQQPRAHLGQADRIKSLWSADQSHSGDNLTLGIQDGRGHGTDTSLQLPHRDVNAGPAPGGKLIAKSRPVGAEAKPGYLRSMSLIDLRRLGSGEMG
jgi:hypothetical protein